MAKIDPSLIPLPSKWLVLDVENTHTDGDPRACVSTNKLVAVGLQYGFKDELDHTFIHQAEERYPDCPKVLSQHLGVGTVLIGHNLKHDIQWMHRVGRNSPWHTFASQIHTFGVWDTMLAEYLLSGQRYLFPSLNDCLKRWNLPVKHDTLKQYFEDGKNTDEIPWPELRSYLEQDVNQTRELAALQMAKAQELGMTALILAQGQAMLAYAMMEYNGMSVDKGHLLGVGKAATMEIVNCEAEFLLWLNRRVPSNTLYHDTGTGLNLMARNIDIGSTKLLCSIFYGGTYEFQYPEPKVAGKRHKVHRKKYLFPGLTKTMVTTEAGTQSVADDALDAIEASPDLDPHGRDLVKIVRRYRLAKKICSTYIPGIAGSITPAGLIHGTIHQVSTGTGRTSSVKPNLQNFPNTPIFNIKGAFDSRFGDRGVLIEADYSQLEVVALAHLTSQPGSPLWEDIRAGKDIHRETGRIVFGNNMTDDERRIVKTINFGLIYGGSVAQLAKQAKVSTAIAQKCKTALYGHYPEIATSYTLWQLQANGLVIATGTQTGHSDKGYPVRGSSVRWTKETTGRRYWIEQGDNPYKPGEVNVRPTIVKNYPIQGLATADIVPMAVGMLYRRLYNPTSHLYDTVLPINVIHDSVLFDCRIDKVDDAVRLIRDTMEAVPDAMNRLFPSLSWELPLKVKVKVGPNWADTKEYT